MIKHNLYDNSVDSSLVFFSGRTYNNLIIPVSLESANVNCTVFDWSGNIIPFALNFRYLGEGLHLLTIPKNVFDVIPSTNVDDEVDMGVTSYKRNYGKYYITITPKWEKRVIVLNDEEENIYECELIDGNIDGAIARQGSIYRTLYKSGENINRELFIFYPNTLNPFEDELVEILPSANNFNEVVIEITYMDKDSNVESLRSYMLNDIARDMETGTYQIYDDNGLKLEQTGVITGNVIHRYQIVQTDRFEIRKKIKD